MNIFVRVCAAAALAVLLGCGGHKTTVSADGTTVTTNDDTKTTTVTTAQGSESIGGTVDPAKLGVAIYPGAIAADNSQISTSTQQGTGAVAAFKTTDDFSKVEAYYKGLLPQGAEKINMTEGGSSMAEFQIGDQTSKQMTLVTLQSKAGETDILISNTTKN